MWKPDHPATRNQGPAARRDSRNMAIRRRLIRGKVTFAILGITVLVLKARQDFLEAGSAILLTDWNHDTSSEIIIPRANRELKLFVPTLPGLVLVEADPDQVKGGGVLRRLIGRLQGATKARAAELPPVASSGTMVSLLPRRQGVEGGTTP